MVVSCQLLVWSFIWWSFNILHWMLVNLGLMLPSWSRCWSQVGPSARLVADHWTWLGYSASRMFLSIYLSMIIYPIYSPSTVIITITLKHHKSTWMLVHDSARFCLWWYRMVPPQSFHIVAEPLSSLSTFQASAIKARPEASQPTWMAMGITIFRKWYPYFPHRPSDQLEWSSWEQTVLHD